MRQDSRIYLIVSVVFFLIISAFPAYCEPLAPYRLTLEEAIQKGLQANVGVLVAGTRVTEAEGTRERRLSSYLPHAHIETPAVYQTVNIKAQGIQQFSVKRGSLWIKGFNGRGKIFFAKFGD